MHMHYTVRRLIYVSQTLLLTSRVRVGLVFDADALGRTFDEGPWRIPLKNIYNFEFHVYVRDA